MFEGALDFKNEAAQLLVQGSNQLKTYLDLII